MNLDSGSVSKASSATLGQPDPVVPGQGKEQGPFKTGQQLGDSPARSGPGLPQRCESKVCRYTVRHGAFLGSPITPPPSDGPFPSPQSPGGTLRGESSQGSAEKRGRGGAQERGAAAGGRGCGRGGVGGGSAARAAAAAGGVPRRQTVPPAEERAPRRESPGACLSVVFSSSFLRLISRPTPRRAALRGGKEESRRKERGLFASSMRFSEAMRRCHTEEPGLKLPLICCTGARRLARSPGLGVMETL